MERITSRIRHHFLHTPIHTTTTTNCDIWEEALVRENGYVFFSDIDNDEATRETISLAADTEAGCVLVQTSHYEITGDHKLNATELRVGEGANLTLSTDSAEVAEQILVNNAKLTVEGTELAADITATNAATVNLVADATVNGDITTSNANLGIDNSTVTGKLALAETKAAITHSATVTGDISFNTTPADQLP